MLLWTALIVLLVLIFLVGYFKDLLYSAISLAMASMVLSVILFKYEASMAAVFELSVCAGLITVLFVSTISMTKDSDRRSESAAARYFLIGFILLFLGLNLGLARWMTGLLPVAGKAAVAQDFREVFWGLRATDLLAQISLILAGVFGIVAIFKRAAEGRKHE